MKKLILLLLLFPIISFSQEDLLKGIDTISGKEKVLLVPANPLLKRTIIEGVYYINEIPLMESNFFDDDFAKGTTSNVLDMIGKEYKDQSFSISLGQQIPREGIIIGNTLTTDDLMEWANLIDETMLPAGGASFFNAILRKIKVERKKTVSSVAFGKKALYLCGSNYQPSRAVVRKAKENGASVSYMPRTIFCDNNYDKIIQKWANEIIKIIQNKDKVVIAIDELECKGVNDLANKINDIFGVLIKKILERVTLEELLIEGGATAYSIIEHLGYKKFYPEQELSQGVIRMEIEQTTKMHLTLKPGSYQWTDSVWNF